MDKPKPTNEELKAKFLAERGATVLAPADIRDPYKRQREATAEFLMMQRDRMPASRRGKHQKTKVPE